MNLQINTLEAFSKIQELDQGFIGTPHYMGLAYYWNYAYRHYLRDASAWQRKKVHNKFLAHNLQPDGQTDSHLQIIHSVIKKF
jgi:hypothetical protein